MRLAPLAVLPLLAASLYAQPDRAPVVTEFRVFDGTEEVTAAARLRVTPSAKSNARPKEFRAGTIELPPAVYDVQAVHSGPGGLVSVKSVEGLAVLHYPDEGGRHLEVINLAAGHGALQLRAARGRLETRHVAVFPAGKRDNPVGRPLAGTNYVLAVLPAGQYDVRVHHGGPDTTAEARWLIGIEVPVDRTRLKIVEGEP